LIVLSTQKRFIIIKLVPSIATTLALVLIPKRLGVFFYSTNLERLL
jgi:hypothetical protein